MIKFRIKILMWRSTTNHDKITFQYVFNYSFKLIKKKDLKTSFHMNQLTKIHFSGQGLKIVGNFAKPKIAIKSMWSSEQLILHICPTCNNNFPCRCNMKYAFILWFCKSTTFSSNLVLTDTKYSCYIDFYVVVH